ncbi:hypothetical protein PG985_007908 [Apiospora marii]|uniref:uncharacterized protein n=1 Tax=Apiospora marii TaxID=335849 RepID=UPI00313158AF
MLLLQVVTEQNGEAIAEHLQAAEDATHGDLEDGLALLHVVDALLQGGNALAKLLDDALGGHEALVLPFKVSLLLIGIEEGGGLGGNTYHRVKIIDLRKLGSNARSVLALDVAGRASTRVAWVVTHANALVGNCRQVSKVL